MRAVPGTLRSVRVPFGATHWSVIAACSQAGGATPEEAQSALAALCGQYWPPLYSFARRRGYGPADAQDLVQGFFEDLLEKRSYERADPLKGKFRSFLVTVFKRFLSDVAKREESQKRGGDREHVSFEWAAEAALLDDLPAWAAAAAPHEDSVFERQWAETLVQRTMDALRTEYARESKAEWFDRLRGFLLAGEDLPTQEEMANRLGIPAATVRSQLTRLRARYRAVLRAEVARTVLHETDIDEELRYLCRVLSRG